MIKEIHIIENETNFIRSNSSLNIKIAIRNIMEGAKYWSIPIVDNLSNFAPFTKSIMGADVMTPQPISKKTSFNSPPQKCPSMTSKYKIKTTASGISKRISMKKPWFGPIGRDFLKNP